VKTIIIILCGIWVVDLFIIFMAYILFFDHDHNLSKWRKTLIPEMKVHIDDGSMNYTGTIVSVTESGWIRIMNDNGKTASHGSNCIFPISETFSKI